MTSMPVLGPAGQNAQLVAARPGSWMPKALGMEGPVMSASRTPALLPRRGHGGGQLRR